MTDRPHRTGPLDQGELELVKAWLRLNADGQHPSFDSNHMMALHHRALTHHQPINPWSPPMTAPIHDPDQPDDDDTPLTAEEAHLLSEWQKATRGGDTFPPDYNTTMHTLQARHHRTTPHHRDPDPFGLYGDNPTANTTTTNLKITARWLGIALGIILILALIISCLGGTA